MKKKAIKLKTIKILEKTMEMHKAFFLTYMKMDVITQEICKNNDIALIVDENGILWLHEKHIEEKLDHKCLRAITRKYPSEYRNNGKN